MVHISCPIKECHFWRLSYIAGPLPKMHSRYQFAGVQREAMVVNGDNSVEEHDVFAGKITVKWFATKNPKSGVYLRHLDGKQWHLRGSVIQLLKY